MIDIYGIVIAALLVINKVNQIKFFKKIFLVINISLKVVFKMLFFILISANINFLKQKLRQRIYITQKALLTIKYIKIIGKKKFVVIALNSKYKILVVHIASLIISTNIHSSCKFQITGLITEEALLKVFIKYTNFVNMFFSNLLFKLFEYIGINNYTIKLVNGQKPFYILIYNLKSLQLGTLKVYIEINLIKRFIRLYKSPANILIFFNQKLIRFF